jgi:NCS1 family nucleobase:cation symporter-1
VHSLANYAFAVGLFSVGLDGWQILAALAVGAALLFALLGFSGFMGQRAGVPLAVMSRISFGVRGARLASLLCVAVTAAWFGIQTFLASVVLRILLVALVPQLQQLDTNSILGLSTLGWTAVLALWIVQLVIAGFGLDMIRAFEAVAGPVIVLTMVSLAAWVFIEAKGAIQWTGIRTTEGGGMWWAVFAGGALSVAIHGSFLLNFGDATRPAVSRKWIVRGTSWGITINTLLFGAIVVVLAGGQYTVNGTIIDAPSDIVENIPDTQFLVLACLAILILAIPVNLTANFLAPVQALAHLFPGHLDPRKAAWITGALGLAVLPWNLYGSPLAIVYFLSGLGALLGPLFGVVMANYWLLHRVRINAPELNSEGPPGTSLCRKGVNPRAVIALFPAFAAALLMAFVPSLEAAAPFAWLVGAGLGALTLCLVSGRTRWSDDVGGPPRLGGQDEPVHRQISESMPARGPGPS